MPARMRRVFWGTTFSLALWVADFGLALRAAVPHLALGEVALDLAP